MRFTSVHGNNMFCSFILGWNWPPKLFQCNPLRCQAQCLLWFVFLTNKRTNKRTNARTNERTNARKNARKSERTNTGNGNTHDPQQLGGPLKGGMRILISSNMFVFILALAFMKAFMRATYVAKEDYCCAWPFPTIRTACQRASPLLLRSQEMIWRQESTNGDIQKTAENGLHLRKRRNLPPSCTCRTKLGASPLFW